MPKQFPPPVVLMAVDRDRELAQALEDRGFVVIKVPTGKMALALARGARPDVLILGEQLPDMSGLEMRTMIRQEAGISPMVPVLVLGAAGARPAGKAAAGQMASEELLKPDIPLDELARRIEEYARTGRMLLTEGSGGSSELKAPMLTGAALGLRARELGALMVRMHAALSCLVFSIDASLREPETVSGMVNAARTSDVLGPLGSTDIGVIAPVTDHTGAVAFARRMSTVLQQRAQAAPTSFRGELRVGYAAIDNLKYSPVDPLVLMARAAAAVNDGVPHPTWPWIRSAPNGSDDRSHSAEWTKRTPGFNPHGRSGPRNGPLES